MLSIFGFVLSPEGPARHRNGHVSTAGALTGAIGLATFFANAATLWAQTPAKQERASMQFRGVQPGATSRAELVASPAWGQPQSIRRAPDEFDLHEHFQVLPTAEEQQQREAFLRLTQLDQKQAIEASQRNSLQREVARIGLEGGAWWDYTIEPWQRISLFLKDDVVWLIDMVPPVGMTLAEVERQLQPGEPLTPGRMLAGDRLLDQEPLIQYEYWLFPLSDMPVVRIPFSIPQSIRIGPITWPASLTFREYSARRVAIFYEDDSETPRAALVRLFADVPHRYPVLGLRLVSEASAEHRPPDWGHPKSVRVVDIEQNSPAARAGFLIGDTVLSLNDRELEDTETFQGQLLGAVWQAQPLEFVIWRDGNRRTVSAWTEPQPLAAAYIRRGQFFSEKRQYTRAIEDLTRALAIQPADAQALSLRGDAYRLNGQFSAAEKDLTAAIASNPRSPAAYFRRGLFHRTQKQFEAAIQDFTASLRLAADDAVVHLERGTTHEEMGNLELALRDYSRAIELAPDDIEAHRKRAALLGRVGEAERAKADLASVERLQGQPSDRAPASEPPKLAPGPGPLTSPEAGVDAASDTESSVVSQVIDRGEGRVTRAEGGRVVLENGFAVSLPPEAVASAGQLQVERHVVDAANGGLVEDVNFYRIKLVGSPSELQRPARLQIPYAPDRLPAGITEDRLFVTHLTSQGQIERLRAQPVGPGIAEVQISSFSDVSPEWESSYAGIAEQAIQDHRTKRLIRAAFYSQGDSMWCWAACAAMLFKTYGGDRQPQQIAETFGKNKSTGASLWPVIGVNIDQVAWKLGYPSLPVHQSAFGGFSETRLRGWLIDQLRQGRPVWVGLPNYKGFRGGDHAVLVVGYDHVGFYIHDSSGALIQEIQNRQLRRTGRSGSAVVDDHRAAFYHIRFDHWRESVYPSFLMKPNIYLVNSAYVEADAQTGSSQFTVQFVSKDLEAESSSHEGPGSGWGCIGFQRSQLLDSTLSHIFYQWNGKAPGGGGFSPSLPELDDLGLEGLCNSDQLDTLSFLVHNTSDQVLDGQLVVTLDSIPLGGPIPVQVPAETTNYKLFPVQDAARPRQSRGRQISSPQYVALAERAHLGIKEALDFERHPLPLGNHNLKVTLTAGGREHDSGIIYFTQRAALVPPPTAEKVPSPEGRSVHRVTWRPSEEERRLGPGRFHYQVRHKVRHESYVADRIIKVDVEKQADGSYSFQYVLPSQLRKEATLAYQVRLVAGGNEALASPWSQITRPLDAAPMHPELSQGDRILGNWMLIGDRRAVQRYLEGGGGLHTINLRAQRELLGFDAVESPLVIRFEKRGNGYELIKDDEAWEVTLDGSSDDKLRYTALRGTMRAGIILDTTRTYLTFGEIFYLPSSQVRIIE